MANQDNIVTKLKAQLTEEKDAFWARKVAFSVAMKISLHSIGDEKIKGVGLTLLAGDLITDLEEHYGKASLDLKEFTYDCEQFLNALLDRQFDKVSND